jgi:hypothetical protein
MKALLTNLHHYIIMLIDRGDEPLYYYLRFRVAVFVMAFLIILNFATFHQMQKWNREAKANLSYNIKLLRANNRLNRENDMLADLMTSSGQIGIMKYYCDDFRRWQDRQLRNANTEKSLTEKENN